MEEIKNVLEFENKIVVVSSYSLTPCCSGRDNDGINFKHRACNVPPLNNGVRQTRDPRIKNRTGEYFAKGKQYE